MRFRIGAVMAVASATVIALAGCSGSGDSGGSGGSDSGVDAASLVQESSQAMQDLTGAHVVITAEGRVPNLKVTKLEADIASKPTPVATGTASIQVGQQNQEAQLIYVDGRLYSDIAEPGKWTDYGTGTSIYNLAVLFDQQNGLANALANLKDPKAEGSEEIDGVKTTKITGTASTTDVAQLAGARKAPEKEQTVPMTVWIADEAPHYLVRAQITPVPDTSVTMTLSEFGKTVTAQKPV
ncbi:LppX_LprAFG lipoprotein [Mycolicibacterium iranicum]|nr:LppX_LprAFG lipoprotein [Mycolicibacterium iranicum]